MDATEELEKLAEVFGRQEELDPELRRYSYRDERLGGLTIKHPLVFSLFHTPAQNAMVNDALRRKKQLLDTARNEENWHSYLFLHERPHRMDAFMEVSEAMNDEDYWTNLASIWVDSENIWQAEILWTAALHSDRPGRDAMMEEDERQTFTQLPSEVEVFRGFCEDGRERGLSWTTDRKKAEWFAARLAVPGDMPRLAIGRVEKDKIVACFDGRGENEVVVFPDDVDRVTILNLS